MFAVMILTSVVSVAAALVAGAYVPWLGAPVKAGQEHVAAPLASIPFLLAGFWIMMRIWRVESRRRYEASLRPPDAP